MVQVVSLRPVRVRTVSFHPRSYNVSYVADKVTLGQVLDMCVGFSLPVLFHRCAILIFFYALLLPEGQIGESW
jgi:hypothetical protein